MSLREAAEQARSDYAQTQRQASFDRVQASLDKAIEKWDDRFSGFGRLAEDGFAVPELPAREEFVRVPYEKSILVFESYRQHRRVYGWRIEVEGVPFLFSDDTQHGSLWLIYDCPLCGCTGASTFYGLSDLGARLANGPKSGHSCLEGETQNVGYAIGQAMRETGLSAESVIDKTFELHRDLLRIASR